MVSSSVRTAHESAARLAATIAAYDRSPDYFEERFADVNTEELLTAFTSKLESSSRVVDLGCGTGRDANQFIERGYRVIGVDLSAALLERARRTAPNASFLIGDLAELPLDDNSVDATWSLASMVHLDLHEAARVLSESIRVLRPGGVAFFSVPEGQFEGWRDDGTGGQRWFRYFTSQHEFDELLRTAGYTVLTSTSESGIESGHWINATATKGPAQ